MNAEAVEQCGGEPRPRPLLDQEALAEEIFRGTPMQVSRKSSGDAAGIALRLARPMPTREQIAEALNEVAERLDFGKFLEDDDFTAVVSTVMALINGDAK